MQSAQVHLREPFTNKIHLSAKCLCLQLLALKNILFQNTQQQCLTTTLLHYLLATRCSDNAVDTEVEERCTESCAEIPNTGSRLMEI